MGRGEDDKVLILNLLTPEPGRGLGSAKSRQAFRRGTFLYRSQAQATPNLA